MKEMNDVVEASKGLNLHENFMFDLIDTGVRRSTSDQLEDMVVMYQHYPGTITHILYLDIFFVSEDDNQVKPKYSNQNNNEIFDAVMEAV
jgi:hypothetical protein